MTAYRYVTRWAAASTGTREKSKALLNRLGEKGAEILGLGVYDTGDLEGGYFIAFSDEVNDCKSDVVIQFNLEDGKGLITTMILGYSRKVEKAVPVTLGSDPEKSLLKALEEAWLALRATPEYRFIMRLN